MAVTDDFTGSELNLNGVVSIGSPTALVWGPDGRLYVTQQAGDIKVLDVAFGDPNPADGDTTNSFYVTAAEDLDLVQDIPNHNDDGSDAATSVRQVTGIDVVQQFDSNGDPVEIGGKPAVVMYVSSSDSRIGAGGSGNDANLDTNSGVLTRITQTETGWDVVDIVRGLPRSEENHATNGLEVIQEVDPNTGELLSERLIVASGGNANTGAPSNNFAGQQETPYSAALLEVDLDEIRAIETADGLKIDDGRVYVYDMPTLDDPTREGLEGDPFGGNDGLNSAKLLADGPVQIYSAGYRNPYDVEVTDDGRVYTYDNGANNNWGGRPAGEDEDLDNNSVEAESGTPTGYIATNLFVEDNAEINGNFDPQNWDSLHEATRSDDLNGRSLSAGLGGVQTYQWNHPDFGQPLTLVYGGHPNPTRAEGAKAGLLYTPQSGVGNAKLMVSNVGRDDGQGGTTSDFLEVVEWLSFIGYSDEFINSTVVALDPGVLYADTFAAGFGGAGATGRPTTTDVFSLIPDANGPIGLPADIAEIVANVNEIEGNYLEAGFTDGSLDTGKGSVNGLTEYTSTIFDDAGLADMKGALIAASLNQGEYYIIGRDADGNVATTTTTSGNGGGIASGVPRTIAADREFLASGGAPLGLASIGDDLEPFGSVAFRGTIWAAIYKQNGPVIEIFQPGTADGNALLGENNYAGVTPVDITDNDLDGVDHINDPFDFDADNGLQLAAGKTLVLNFSQVDLAGVPEFSGTIGDTGLLGAALDGVTPNRDAKSEADGFPVADQEAGLFDNGGNIIPGGNAPILQIKSVQDGTAVGGANTLRDGLHTGVKLDDDVKRLVAEVEIFNWYADQPGGERVSGLTFGDGTQENFVRFVFGDIGGGQLGLEVGLEVGDSYQVIGTSTDPAFIAALTTGGATSNQKKITLQLEIADIGGGYDLAANYKVNGETDFQSVTLSTTSLPVGVLRDVLDGTHQISDGDTTLSSGAAVGIVAEKADGVSFTSVDFDVIRIEGIGNEVVATTVAEAEAPGTAGEDTVIYDGPGGDITLDPSVENFDGSPADTNWSVTGNQADNLITVGGGDNTITTGDGEDVVTGTRADLNGDEITDFSEDDKVIITDATAADVNNVSFQAGSAIVNVNGTSITFSGPDFEGFDASTGDQRFAIEDGENGVEISLIPDETVIYRLNAGGGNVTALDDGPDWISDGSLDPSGPITITGTLGSTFSNGLTDAEDEIDYTPDVDPSVVPWELFVNERSENVPGGAELTYNFDVEVGATYKITLLYVENWQNSFSAPPRIFDVAVEGSIPAEFDDIHPLRDATDFVDGTGADIPTFSNDTDGAIKQPYLGVVSKREFVITASDDSLSLAFQHNGLTGFQNPKINAIEISQLGVVPPVVDETGPVVTSILVEDSLSDQDSPRDLTLTLTDETALDIGTFTGLDGSELSFTGVTPSTVSSPSVQISGDGKTATLVYELSPPSDTSAWPDGDFSVSVAASAFSDAAGNNSVAASFPFTFAAPLAPGDVVLAVNAGGPEVDGADYGLPGVTFEADPGANPHPTVDFSNVTTGPASSNGNNTNNSGADDTPFTGEPVPDTVFTSERWGNDLSYNVDVPNGTYTVDLYFAETFFGQPGGGSEGGVGSRSFDATIEGQTVLDDYDLFDDGDGVLGNGVGAPGVKIIKSFDAEVTDGVLNINFDTIQDGGEIAVDNAKISAFVIRVPEATGATAALTGDANVAEDAGTASYTVTLSEAVTETTVVTLDIAGSSNADVPGDAEATGGGTQLTVTFEPGAPLAQTVTVDISDDTLPELDESFTVTMSGIAVTSGGAASVTTTIPANDGPVDSVDGTPVIAGDFSDDGAAPTDLGTLSAGETVIVASQQGDSAPGGRERDYFTFTVAEGDELTGIILEDWQTAESGSPQAFIGIQAGSVITVDPVTFENAGDLLGGYIYNEGDVEGGPSDGNLLSPSALGNGSAQGIQFGDGSGFSGPLPAGTYTIWLNQGGEISTATLRLVTQEFVEVVNVEVTAADAIVENGDFGTTDLGYDLTASDNFTGDIEITFSLDDGTGAAEQTQTVSFTNGAGRLEFPIANDNVDNGDDALSLLAFVSGAVSGSDATVTFTDPAGAVASATDDDGPLVRGEVVYAINAGGPALTQDGIDFAEGTSGTDGNPFTSGAPFTDSGGGNGLQPAFDGTVYKTEINDGGNDGQAGFTFSAAVPDPDKVYFVDLYFGEIFTDNTGARVFSVFAEGGDTPVIADLDVVAFTGDPDVGAVIQLADPIAPGANGAIDLEFLASQDRSKVSAIVIREAVGQPDVTVSVTPTEVAEDGGQAEVVFTRLGNTDEPLTLTFTLTDGSAVAGADYTVPAVTSVTFAAGDTEASAFVDVIDNGDESATGTADFNVTITGASVPSGGAVGVGDGTAAVTIADDEFVQPTDIDGDGIDNTDDPFAYDASNGLDRVLTTGNSFRQDFSVDTADAFGAEAGFTGIMINPAQNIANTSREDPYGDQTNEATTLVENGVFKTQSSANDSFSTGTGGNNTIKDNYQSAADVTGVDTFKVEAKANNIFADVFDGGIPTAFASYGITVGAGGVDDFVKFVVGATGNDDASKQLRVELGHNGSLVGNASSVTLASVGIDKAAQANIASVEFELVIDKNGTIPDVLTAGTIVGIATFLDDTGAILGTATTPVRGIAPDGSLAAAIAGENPLTGGAGGLAYGISITHFNNNANQFTGEWDYLALTATDPIDLSIGAPADPVAEGGDEGVTTVDFSLSAPSFTGTMDIDYAVNGAPATATGVTFTDGVGVLSVEAANDDIADGDAALSVALTGTNNPSVTIDPTAAVGTVTEDDAAPVSVPETIVTFEDVPITFDPAANDTDADSDPAELTVVAVGASSDPDATVALVDGEVTVTPTNGFLGDVTFTYDVADASGNTTQGIATVTVTAATLISISNAPTKIETGDTGSVTLVFPVTTAPAAEQTLSLTYTVDGETRTSAVSLDATGAGSISVDVANDDEVGVTDLTTVALTGVTTAGFAISTANATATGRIIEDDEVSRDIMVDEDIPVGDESDPYELSDGVETIDTSGTTQPTNLVGNAEDNTFTVGLGEDKIDLQDNGGADKVVGTPEALDGIEIVNAEDDDEVVITGGENAVIVDVVEGSTEVTIDADGDTTDASDQFTVVYAESNLIPTLENGVLKVAPGTAQTFRIQAEDFDSSTTYAAQGQGAADGGQVAFLPDNGASGTATYDLTGIVPAGTYTLVVVYFDENDGESTIGVSVTSTGEADFDATFVMDEATPGNAAQAQNLRAKTFADVVIGSDGQLVLTGTTEGGEFARIDYFEFIEQRAEVDPENSSPYAPFPLVDQTTTEGEEFSYNAGAAFVDDEEDILTFTATSDKEGGSLPEGLAFDPDTGIFSGTPTESGAFVITVTADDDNTSSEPQTFNLNIGDVNFAPEVTTPIADQFINLNDPINLDVSTSFNDPDGTALTFSLLEDVPGLSIDETTGVITGSPTGGTGSVQVTVVASDGEFDTQDTFLVNVGGGASQDPIRIEAEDADALSGYFIQNNTQDRIRLLNSESTGTATFNLADVPAGQYAVRIAYYDEADGQGNVALSLISDGVETPVDGFELNEDTGTNAANATSFRVRTLEQTVQIGDGDQLKLSGAADGGEFTRIDYLELVPLSSTNFAPTETPDGVGDVTLVGLVPLDINVADAFIDPEEDPLKFAIVDGPSWLQIDENTGALTGTPDVGGVFSVTVSAADTVNAQIPATSTFTLTVEIPDNELPVLDFPVTAFTVEQGILLEESVTFTDPEGGDITYSLSVDKPDWLSIDEFGTLSGTPGAEDVVTDLPVSIIATDPLGGTSSVEVLITVSNTNDAPEVGTPLEDQSATLGEAFLYELPVDAFTDADIPAGDELSYSAELVGGGDLPAWLSIDPITGALSGTPDTGDDVAVIITATDLAGLSVSAAPIIIDVSAFEVPTDPVQIEAEDFSGVGTAQNYVINNLSAASGDAILRLPADALGVVTHDLSAYAGQSFKVAVTYIDETDGISNGKVTVDDVELGSWVFDGTAGTQNVPGGETGNFVQPGNFRTVELDTVIGLTETSVLTLEVQAQGGEFGRVDFITLIPAALPETNEPPIAVTVTPLAPELAEDTDTTLAVKVGDITITDDILGTNELSLAGADADAFEIVGTELFLKAGTVLDFETKPTFDVTVQVNDAEVGVEPVDAFTDFTLTLADVNEAPLLTVTPVLTELSQDADTTAPTKVADIIVSDDALGTFELTLSGDDAALFEIVTDEINGTIVLNLIAGATLDAIGNAQLDVTVELDDPEIGEAVAEATEAVAITVLEGDVVEEDTVVLRINAFGDTVAATDGGPDWQADLKDDLGTPTNENNAYLTLESADTAQDRGDTQGYSGDGTLLPTSLPQAVVDTARSSNEPFSYDIPVGDLGGPGDFEVKLYFAELFTGNQTPGNRVFDIEVEGSSPGVLQDFDPSAPTGGGDLSAISYDVTVTDGELNIRFAQDAPVPTDNPIINAIEIVRKGDVVVGPMDGEALFTANIAGGDVITSSTFATNSMQITNQSANDVSITRVVIDLADTIIPDTGFDTQTIAEGGPIGDATNKPFQLDGGTSGLSLADFTITMGDEIVDPQTGGEGNNQLILEFEDGAFAVGDLLSFSIDIDPFTATVGPIGGAVAGFELTGGTVSVEFSDGTSATSVITPPDDTISGRALVKAGQDDLGSPTLTLGDGTTAARVVNQANLPISVDAGVANAGETARIFILDTAFVSNGDSISADPPPQAPNGIQGNNAQKVANVVEVTLDENGQFDGTIPVTRSTTQSANAGDNLGFNYFAVGVVDGNGEVTQISDPLVVEYDPNANVPPIGDPTGNPVGDVLLRINAFGSTVAALDDGPDWQEDTAAAPSPYFTGPQNRGDVDGTPATPGLTDVPDAIFATARSDDSAFSYTIPVIDLPGITAGDTVTVNLYFAEAASNPDFVRAFDVQLEGVTAIDDLNPAAFFGSGNGGVISTVVEVTGGTLNIDFLNNNVQNAIVSGIEVIAGGENPINAGGVIDPPADPADALEVLGVDDGNFDGTVQGVAVDSQNDGGNNGSVVLTVLDGNDTVDASNFGENAIQLKNTGNKEVAAVFIDIRNAVFADQVFDNDGTGGDTAAKAFQIQSDGNTGAFFVGANGVNGNNDDNLFFEGATPAADTSGLGSSNISGGYRGLLVRFDGNVDGGFNGGETVGFSGDGDSNSIAGFSSGLLNPNNVTSTNFDTGGQSGAELVGSSFTVLFADGTTATGYLGSDTTQAGAAGEAVQGRATKEAVLSVSTGSGTFDSGQTGTYGGTVPTITVAGTPGDTVRVVLHKGFQPTDGTAGGSPDSVESVIQGRLDTLVPDFAVNNAFDVQTVDVVIGNDGLATVPASAFDFVNTTSGESFAGDDVQPLALTAAVVEQVSDTSAIVGSGASDLVPVGPVSQPIYLTNPTGIPVDDSGVVNEPPDGFFELEGSGDNKYFKIQIEDENGTGGTNPGGKWEYLTTSDELGNQDGFQGTGYYLFGSDVSKGIDNANGGDELLEYTIYVPEEELGTYSFSFVVSRDDRIDPNPNEETDLDGTFAGDQQNDLWLNFKHAEDAGNGDIAAFLTGNGSNNPEPEVNGFIKLFGGPANGGWGNANMIDGLPNNFGAQIEITEAGLYTIQVDGRSQGYHIDYFELFQGTNPGAGSANSDFVLGAPGDGGDTGGGGNTGDPVRIQAEDFTSSNGYAVQGAGAADQGELIAVSGGAGSTGTATYNLSAAGVGAGTYDVVIGYVDESDGESTLNVNVGDKSAQIIFDDDATSNNAVGSQNFREFIIANAIIDGNDVLTLNGINDGGEFTRVDYIDFFPSDGTGGGGDTGGGDTGGGDTGGGDTGGGDTGGGDTGGGDTGGGDTGGGTGNTFSTNVDGLRLRGTEDADTFLFFGGGTADALGFGGADAFNLQSEMFTDGVSTKVKISDYDPTQDTVSISGFSINSVTELNNRVQILIGPDDDLLEFVNLTEFDDIVFN